MICRYPKEPHPKDLGEMLKPARKGEYEYPRDKHRYIVELMKEFELCYPLKKDQVIRIKLSPTAASKAVM